MAKTRFLQIRLSPEDRTRIELAAAAEHLEPSTWARQVLLQALTSNEDKRSSAKSQTRRTRPTR